MAYVNWVTYEAQLKVVYYGPAYAGKTTSLRYLSLRLETDVKELPTTDDRLVFFEYTQSQKLAVKNLDVKLLCDVPGHQKYGRNRRLCPGCNQRRCFRRRQSIRGGVGRSRDAP